MIKQLDQRINSIRPKHKQLTCLLLLMICASGCTLLDGNVAIAYRAETSRKSSLSTLKPLIIQVEVQDQRGLTEQRLVGHKKGGFGNVLASIKTTQDVASILRQAVESELQNNGHTTTLKNDPKSDVTLAVRLRKYWTEPTVRIFDVQVLGTLTADIEVVHSLEQPVYSRTITGTHVESWQLAIDEAYQSVLKGALNEFVRNFARDPSILKALQDISSP
jgi:uncharacterized lipoprotein YajG